VVGQILIMFQRMLLRIFQVQIAIKSGLEIDDESVVLEILDDEWHIQQLCQRIAGNRVSSFNAIHLDTPVSNCFTLVL